jgi:hypothetical protein
MRLAQGGDQAAYASLLVCPLDDPAHQLVGHVVPAALMTACGASAGRRSLD